ncbi:hypothetical protein BJ546DRAFT_948262 [Cryomyces antarcticus]
MARISARSTADAVSDSLHAHLGTLYASLCILMIFSCGPWSSYLFRRSGVDDGLASAMDVQDQWGGRFLQLTFPFTAAEPIMFSPFFPFLSSLTRGKDEAQYYGKERLPGRDCVRKVG